MGFEKGPNLNRFNRRDSDEHHQEAVSSQSEATEEIEGFLRSSYRYVPIDELLNLRDKWVARGTITAEAANALPGMKEAAEQAAVRMLRQDAVHRAGFNTDEYVQIRDQWVAAGIVTADEVNNFPRVREIAENDLLAVAVAVNSGTDTIEFLKRRWIDAGVLTEREANKLIETGRAEREQYLHSQGGA